MKIQRISEFQAQFQLFSSAEEFSLFLDCFFQSQLGKIYLAIPWDELVKTFGLKEKRKGRSMLFSPKGRIALMLLKSYSGLSDARLLEQLNGNIEYQFFCDLFLGNNRLKNTKIISQIRCELSSKLNIEATEKVFYNYWKPYINEPEKIVIDATCYESDVRFPTDVKLLWESVEYVVSLEKGLEKGLDKSSIRSKYITWKKHYVSYSKMRRKTSKKKRSQIRASLRLIEKYLAELDQYTHRLNQKQKDKLEVIKKVCLQQYEKFYRGVNPKNRIVSLHKSYVRPIVRGKEVKPVEFGAKVHKLQIDGISFIEHISFDAFNEGTRLLSGIYKAQLLTHRKVKVLGADAIYATNKNRNYVTQESILTDFKPKGRKSKHESELKKVRRLITKERASRLEGSFGKDKECYGLRTIKAETELNEILWIFFGIHTGNALEIGRRMAKALSKSA